MILNNQNELVLKAKAVLESLESGNPKAITNYIHPDQYVQHNLALSNGRAAMLGALDHLKEIGTKVSIKRILADGDYVALHSEYDFLDLKLALIFSVLRMD